MKPLLVSSGEPAGIGPDVCLALAVSHLPIVILGDKSLLAQRAEQLGLNITLKDYAIGETVTKPHNQLTVLHVPCTAEPIAGVLNPQNASYVLAMLTIAVQRCLQGEFSALITAPVHKAVINQAGFAFSGHTEFLAHQCNTETVVMMLACDAMRVALVTTHLPLKDVSEAVTMSSVTNVITCLDKSLKQEFGISKPRIFVAGLNPHAGEDGFLGREEIEVIRPSLRALKDQGIDVHGPFPADTMFTAQHVNDCDAFVAMYHDQGLPVLKYAGFGRTVNITLGLPIIRTSVDHGTALELAGTGKAGIGSIKAAIEMAAFMAIKKSEKHDAH
ncbi:4-hydroxythreonine-4-phosphate dehydrogenase PdxA [Legionella nagasakiensis]|uniref:4-hydroxythreonine-4-phosphate dehydrogenase PdxA n=1 Tax=Legionella nagasakiensis TaxID=535290 RepID=UPI00105448BE|nr:4-hydroxythreonine-4-phosphate dehydrogenase PdxA [Legionella nagasakiensis]